MKSALEILNGKYQKLGNYPTLILKMPSGFTTPKRSGESWYPENVDDWRCFINEFIANCNAYIIPFLNEYCDADAFCKGWDRADKRLQFFVETWIIKLAALYLINGESEKAQNLVIEKLTTPILKKRFASVFEYFSKNTLKK